MLRQGIDVNKAKSTEREGIANKRDIPLSPEASCDTTAQMPILTKAEARNTKLGLKAERQEHSCSSIGGSSVEV